MSILMKMIKKKIKISITQQAKNYINNYKQKRIYFLYNCLYIKKKHIRYLKLHRLYIQDIFLKNRISLYDKYMHKISIHTCDQRE